MKPIRRTVVAVLPSLLAFGCGGPPASLTSGESKHGETQYVELAVESPLSRDTYVLRSVATFAGYKRFRDAIGEAAADDAIERADLEALMNDTSKQRFMRLVAGVLLENFSVFDAAGVIRKVDLDRVGDDVDFEGAEGISNMEAAYVAAFLLDNFWIDGYVFCEAFPHRSHTCPERQDNGFIEAREISNLGMSGFTEHRRIAPAVGTLFDHFDNLAKGGGRDGYVGLSDLELAVQQSGLTAI